MNKILILGNSNIVNRRVLPALSSIDLIESIEIASISSIPLIAGKVTKLYDSYEDALNNFTGNLVYISLANHLHDKYLKMAIDKDFHCIVDKPAIISLETMNYLKEHNINNRIIAEAAVFMEHPSWKSLIDELQTSNNIKKVVGNFLIPELENNNFRMSNELNGGALFDMSAYAMGIGRWLWNCDPKEIKIGSVEIKDDLITSYSLMVDYGLNRVSMGSFGFGYEYVNKVTMFGKNSWGEIDRIFSIPSDIDLDIYGKRNNISWKKMISKEDSFSIFIEKVLKDINSNKSGNWFKKTQDAFNDYLRLANAINEWRQS